MILWITGKAGAGKTTLANKLTGLNTVILDADSIREVWTDLGFSDEDRLENCCRLARLAKILERQGLRVIVSAITPTKIIRDTVYKICTCDFIYITGGKMWENTEYEIPENGLALTIEGNKGTRNE